MQAGDMPEKGEGLMRSRWKKIVLVLAVFILTCTNLIYVNAAENASAVSREEWIHSLVTTFDMKVEDGLMPDDYYTDIADSKYYNDILLAINFGVIDLEAGERFQPDAPVTREFAAQTLNACLGYELEENETYTMNDYADLTYPQAAQIAVNEGWLNLINGAFRPDTVITDTEKNGMINFAKDILKASAIEENHQNVYKFADNIIEIPKSTFVELRSDTKVMIYDTSLKLSIGDSIAVYSNGLAYTYKVKDVEKTDQGILITGEELSYEDAVDSVDAEGVIEADLGNFVPADGVEVNVEYAGDDSTNQAPHAMATSGAKKIKDIEVKKEIGGGKYSCKLTGLKVNYRINDKGYHFSTTGKAIVSCTFSGSKSFTLNLGYINVAGVGKISVDMIYSASGSATIHYTCDFETGIEKDYGSSTRKIKKFSTPSWHISPQGELKTSCKVGFYVNVPCVADGFVYGEVGVKAEANAEIYLDGKRPKVCMDLAVYIFAKMEYSLNVFTKKVEGDEINIYDKNNSPCREYYHIEDGKRVDHCARPESSSSVGKRKYYTVRDAGSGTYSENCFVAPDAEAVEPIFEYKLDENHNATITKYRGNIYALTIPSELDGYPVVAIGEKAFKENVYLGSVVVPDGVTSIGVDAFNGCSRLADITLPNNSKYTYIDERVFANTTSLQDVVIPEYVTEIKREAFTNSGIRSIHLKEKITYIGQKAFYGCSNLSNLVLPKYLEIFGASCFGDCDSLKAVEIPRYIKENDYAPDYHGGVTYWSTKDYLRGMFYECDNLTEVSFAKGITAIPPNIFNGCASIKEIVIPDTVTTIGCHAFNECTSLSKVQLPDTLTKIDVMAFRACTSLTSIHIPDSVVEICQYAFGECSNLEEVHLPNRVTVLGTWAFVNCTSLQRITIPKTVSSVPLYYDVMLTNAQESPFVGCSKLKEIVLEAGMQKIPDYLFKKCDYLETIVIPDSVKEIGKGVFYSSGLKDITLPKYLTSIDDQAFIDCKSLEKIEIPDTVYNMGTNIFEGCVLLSEIKLPKYRVDIPVETFKNCTSLKNINLPGSLQYIYARAFEGCENLEAIAVPEGFKGIESSAFKDCKRLARVDLKGDYISNNVFENCAELKDIKMSNSISKIGKSVFLNCTSVEKIQLSTGLKEIPANAFEGCTYLDNLVIPYGVETIGDEALKKCTKLKNITIPKKVTSISSNAFSYPDMVTVYGSSGSYAEQYAKDKGMTFAAKTTELQSVNFSKEEYSVSEWKSVKIPLTILPVDCSEDVIWTSSDEKVATVNSVGLIKGLKAGECKITVSIGKISKTCKVTVKNAHIGLKLNGESELKISETQTLKCMDSHNEEVEAKELRWWSSNCEVATVDQEGKVTGISDGTTTIEVWLMEDTKEKTTFTINVGEKKDVPTTVEPTCTPQATVPTTPAQQTNTPATITPTPTSGGAIIPTPPSGSAVNPTPITGSAVIADAAYTYEQNKDGKSITITKCSSAASVIDIPSSIDGYTVTQIGKNAFENIISMKVVTFPSELASIEKYAFAGCSALTSVTLPDSLTGLGIYAFKDCTSLTSAVLNEGRINIVTGLFQGCSALSSVTIKDKVQCIRENAFAGCTSLKTLNVPKSLLNIEKNTFLNSGITSITYAGTSTDWKKIKIDFTGNSGLQNAVVITSTGETITAKPANTPMPVITPIPTPKPVTIKVTKPAKVKLKSVKAIGKKKLKVTWKWDVGVSGYQVQYALNKSFTKGKKTKSAGKYAEVKTLTGLKTKKYYYVRVRAYKKSGSKTVYGSWSTVKKCKVK